MMRAPGASRRGFLLLLTLATLGSCGGDTGEEISLRSTTTTGEPPPESRHQVAETVNSMIAGWEDGDGEAACSYMSDVGELVMLKISRQLRPPVEADSCEEAIELSASRLEGRSWLERVAPAEVSIYRNPLEAEALCETRGAIQLQLVEGEWLVAAPYCVD